MKTSSLDQQIHANISSFAAELSALVKQAALESVHAALGAGTPAQAKRGRPKGSKNVAKRGPGRPKSSPSGNVDSDKILAHVRANPGVRSDQIAKQFRMQTPAVRSVLEKLMALKAVRRTGQKRGTQYFAGGATIKTVIAPKAAKKKARRKLSPAAIANLRANLAKARAARAKKLAAR